MGRLYIETAQENGRTYVQDSFFTAPFKITKPFEIRKAVEPDSHIQSYSEWEREGQSRK